MSNQQSTSASNTSQADERASELQRILALHVEAPNWVAMVEEAEREQATQAPAPTQPLVPRTSRRPTATRVLQASAYVGTGANAIPLPFSRFGRLGTFAQAIGPVPSSRIVYASGVPRQPSISAVAATPRARHVGTETSKPGIFAYELLSRYANDPHVLSIVPTEPYERSDEREAKRKLLAKSNRLPAVNNDEYKLAGSYFPHALPTSYRAPCPTARDIVSSPYLRLRNVCLQTEPSRAAAETSFFKPQITNADLANDVPIYPGDRLVTLRRLLTTPDRPVANKIPRVSWYPEAFTVDYDDALYYSYVEHDHYRRRSFAGPRWCHLSGTSKWQLTRMPLTSDGSTQIALNELPTGERRILGIKSETCSKITAPLDALSGITTHQPVVLETISMDDFDPHLEPLLADI